MTTFLPPNSLMPPRNSQRCTFIIIAVIVIVDGNEPNTKQGENLLHVFAHTDIITAKTGKVFHDDALLRIGYFRMQCGNITQEALASKINRSREFLAKIEKGTEHPSIATLVDIADALCISVDDLLIDSLHYSVSTSNTELHRLLLDCNETEQEIIIHTASELKATLVSLGI